MFLPGDMFYILTVMVMVVMGFRSGAILQTFTFFGLLLASIVGPYLSRYLVRAHGFPYGATTYLASVLIIYVLFYLVGKAATMFFHTGGKEVDVVVSLAGAGIGLVKGLIICVIVTHMMGVGSYVYQHSRYARYFMQVSPEFFGRAYYKIYNDIQKE